MGDAPDNEFVQKYNNIQAMDKDGDRVYSSAEQREIIGGSLLSTNDPAMLKQAQQIHSACNVDADHELSNIADQFLQREAGNISGQVRANLRNDTIAQMVFDEVETISAPDLCKAVGTENKGPQR